MYRICRNKRPWRLIFWSKKIPNPSQPIGFMYSPLWKITHQKPIGFMYSPLWKITYHSPSVLCTPPFEKSFIKTPSVLCTPPFEKSLFLVGPYFGLGVHFGKYGVWEFQECEMGPVDREAMSDQLRFDPCTTMFPSAYVVVGLWKGFIWIIHYECYALYNKHISSRYVTLCSHSDVCFGV